MDNNILAIIPARGGSKRLPGKNIKEFNGRPLLEYSILTAKAIRSIEHIILASDIENAIPIATRNKVAWCRLLEENTQDASTLVGTLQQTIKAYQHVWNIIFDWVVLLQPTCPLRQPSLVERWIQQVLADEEADGALTVEQGNYKLGKVIKILDEYYTPDYPPMTPKADIKPMLRENGVFYMFKAANVLAGKPWGERRMIPLETPREQSLANIDTQLDWDIADFLYTKHGYDRMFKDLEFNLHG